MRLNRGVRSVYVASDGSGRHKIGSTGNPRMRAYHLRRDTGLPVSMVHVREASADGELVEIAAHWLLASKRDAGEWFNVTAEQAITAISRALKEIAAGNAPSQRLVKGGRPVLYPDRELVHFAAGTLARINAACGEKERRADFIREAVERELERREKR